LDIHEDFFHAMFFSSKKEPDLNIIEESFQRFNKAKAKDPNNPHPHFFLALAHINLNQWEEALEELQTAEKISQGNNPYHDQLEIMNDFMNDLESFFTQDDDEDQQDAEEDQHDLEVEFEEIDTQESSEKLIMVVEDSTTTRNIITKMLEKEGYNVVEAQDGADAINKFGEYKPDLLLLDIVMPGMNGHQTLAKMKKRYDMDNIPVIMLTAKSSLIDKLKGKMSGSTEYLTKPFSSVDLMKKIDKALG
jgi:twitching motility two-component system response regulator PilG